MGSATSTTAYAAATEGQLGLVQGDIFRSFQAANGTQNYIINSLMTISQRGDFTTSSTMTAGASYYLDRFTGVRNSVTASHQHITTNQPTSLGSYSYRITATSSATGYLLCAQSIENPRDLIGKTVTFSAWVKSNTQVRLRSYPSSSGFIALGGTHSGGGEWELLIFTFTIPTSTPVTDYLNCQVIIFSGAGAAIPLTSGDYIESTLWMLNEGTERAPFSLAGGGTIGGELSLCQRYLYKIQGQAGHRSAAIGYATTPSICVCNIAFPTELRANPTISLNGAASSYRIYNLASYDVCSVLPVINTTTKESVSMLLTTTTGILVGDVCALGFSGSSSVMFDAEL